MRVASTFKGVIFWVGNMFDRVFSLVVPSDTPPSQPVEQINEAPIQAKDFLIENKAVEPQENYEISTQGEKELESVVGASVDEAYAELLFDCPNSFSCAATTLRSVAEEYGPYVSLRILELLQQDKRISKSVDEHQLAHQVGRQTAETFGVNSDAFRECDTTFNYGCQHGFFEYVLGRTTSTKNAATIICESLGDEYSSKFKFYCYHGVGHGVMMAQAYDLSAALDTCDTLDGRFAQDGCWQGVFMENANAGMRNEARDGVFSVEDPLAPCNKVEEKYRHECFINHAGWTMMVFGNDVAGASRACLVAPDGASIKACLQGIGLMITNPVWQKDLYKGEKTNIIEIGQELCDQFPEGYGRECVIGGVENILNFDELNIDRAVQFCMMVEEGLRRECTARIGISLRAQSTDNEIMRLECAKLGAYIDSCLFGANVQ